jgi:hypothetical protein
MLQFPENRAEGTGASLKSSLLVIHLGKNDGKNSL